MSGNIEMRATLKDRREVAAELKSLQGDIKDTGDSAEKASTKASTASGRWAKMGGTIGKAAKMAAVGAGAIAAASALVGRQLYQVGGVFDDVEDTIRVGTGATGKHLDHLVASAKRVGSQVPAEFEAIGPVIADLNTRLGLTGKPLERLTRQFLEAGRITGTAIDPKKMTAAFSAFGIEGPRTSKALDQIYRISQATGVGMNDLAVSVAKNAPAMRQFGFGLSDTASLLGTLDKAGLSGDKTLATLSRAMVGFAQDGRAPRRALQETVSEIDNLAKAGDQSGAVNLAAKVFGTRGAGQFVAAIKSGKVNLDQLTKSVGAGGDTILKAGKDTADFTEKWQQLKNKALLKIEPIATRVFDAMGTGADKVGGFIDQMERGEGAGGKFASALKKVGGFLGDTFGWIRDNREAVGTFAGIILGVAGATAVWSGAQAALNAVMMASPLTWVVLGIALVAAGLVMAYKKSETFRSIVDKLWNVVLKPFGAFLSGVLLDGIVGVAKGFLMVGEYGVRAFGFLVRAAFKTFDGILTAAEKGLGWVPGLGDKIQGARVAFDAFGDRVSNKLDKVANKLRDTRTGLDDLTKPRTIDVTVQVNYGSGLGVLTEKGRNAQKDKIDWGTRALGGPVVKGRPYIVGERRPELFVPDANGRILPRVPVDITAPATYSGDTTDTTMPALRPAAMPAAPKYKPVEAPSLVGAGRDGRLTVNVYVGGKQLKDIVVEEIRDELARR